MKKYLILTFALALVASVGLSAEEESRTLVKLSPTQAGLEIGSQGLAMVERSAQNGVFAVRTFAKCPDGSIFVVTVSSQRGDFDVGTIKMFLNSGVFKMDLDAAGELDVGQIEYVKITYGRNVILEARLPVG